MYNRRERISRNCAFLLPAVYCLLRGYLNCAGGIVMRRCTLIFFLFIVCLVLVLFAACERPADPIPGELSLTTSLQGEIKLYLNGSGNAEIDWGDDTEKTIVELAAPPVGYVEKEPYEVTHIYSSAGAKNIQIKGMVMGLTVHDMEITALYARAMPSITVLDCSNNQLTALNVSSCTALTKLGCFNNQLTALNVSSCTALTVLACFNNQLGLLDVSGLISLEVLECSANQLSSLNVSGCAALRAVSFYDNLLDVDALRAVFAALPDRTIKTPIGEIFCGGSNPGYGKLLSAVKKTVESKNWVVFDTEYTL